MTRIYWIVDGSSGSTDVHGNLFDALEHFRVNFEPFGYKLCGTERI